MTDTRQLSSPRRAWTTLFVLLAMTALPGIALAAQADTSLRVYETRFLSRQAAIGLAMQLCDEQERCQVEPFSERGFSLRGSAAVHEELAALLAERDVPPATQGFRVILLAADHGNDAPDLPEDALQAVADLRAVLPYTGFRVIDSGWVRTSDHASASLGELGSFEVEMRFEGNPERDRRLLVELQIVYRPVHRGQPPADGNAPAPLFLGDPRNLIGSQFGIEVGETVVVGTSRVNGGDEAIVVLLTALPR